MCIIEFIPVLDLNYVTKLAEALKTLPELNETYFKICYFMAIKPEITDIKCDKLKMVIESESKEIVLKNILCKLEERIKDSN